MCDNCNFIASCYVNKALNRSSFRRTTARKNFSPGCSLFTSVNECIFRALIARDRVYRQTQRVSEYFRSPHVSILYNRSTLSSIMINEQRSYLEIENLEHDCRACRATRKTYILKIHTYYIHISIELKKTTRRTCAK